MALELNLTLNMMRKILIKHLLLHERQLCICVRVCRSLVSNSLQPHRLQPAKLLCPWDSPGKNTGVGCHALLQGIFPTQYRTQVSCIGRQNLYCWCHLRSPIHVSLFVYIFLSNNHVHTHTYVHAHRIIYNPVYFIKRNLTRLLEGKEILKTNIAQLT